MTTIGIRLVNSPFITVDIWLRNFMRLLKEKDKQEDHQASSPSTSMFIATLWTIWLDRNEIVFSNASPSSERIMHLHSEMINRLG